jgi:hypothetical protein
MRKEALLGLGVFGLAFLWLPAIPARLGAG